MNRILGTSILLVSVLVVRAVSAAPSEPLRRAAELEQAGDSAGARGVLLNALQQTPNDVATLSAYADFLDRYQETGTRPAYRKCLQALPAGSKEAREVARRLVSLDLIDADLPAARADLAVYQAAGGMDISLPARAAAVAETTVSIPGPLRSFARMAALSTEAQVGDVLPALARNVVMNGYQAARSNDVLEQTEYLKLVVRYLSQARELEKLAGPDKVIRIETCESAQTGELLRVIGFRMRGGCGSEVVLETVNAPRAFLTTDSGFPMSDLEQALRTSRPFTYDYHPTQAPILFGESYWVSAKEKGSGDFLDAFLSDPGLCRFYLGMAKLDRTTAEELRAHVPSARLRAYAHVLDFFGGMFEIRDGHAVVPGGARSMAAWGELAGASPRSGPQFFEKLLAKDDGWLASLYDALARIHGPVQDYLTDPARMRRFYDAVRGQITSPGPARPVFRSNADMMLLTTRLRLDPGGKPHMPGGLGVWRTLFVDHPHGKYDAKLTRAAAGWSDADDVIEALFALSRKSVENEPLKIFMALSDMDRYRARPLEAATVDRLARAYRLYGAQYSTFSESPAISDATIVRFIETMEEIDHIRDTAVREDAAGSMQALAGLWQIFCRQGTLPSASADKALAGILAPFDAAKSGLEVFDASRGGVKILLEATGTPPGTPPQERMLDLLAASGAKDQEVHEELVRQMQRVMDAQRIVSLTNILQLAAAFDKPGSGLDNAAIQKLAARIGEIDLPRAPLSAVEKSGLTFGYWTEKHIESERKLNLRALVDKAGKNAEKAEDVRAALAPSMRDTLVALNYAHYAPPGAEVLYTNPLFVRGHDFVGMQGSSHTWKPAELLGTGWPSSGGGRLVGSLSNLPYALAEAEQNFLIPAQTQALIWGDLVPQMILSAKIPRWGRVTPVQMHWVNLHMQLAASLAARSAWDADLRHGVVDALRPQLAPGRAYHVNELLEAGDVHEAVAAMTPLEMYVMAGSLQSSAAALADPAGIEIRTLAGSHAQEVSDAAISDAFGTPKPTLANSYRSELLKLRTFPTLMGYSSRIMAESWESNTLYWAALADQLHLAPAQLNVLIPQWTEKVVERIFASHLEDWPALLRSLRLVGDDVRAGNLGQPATAGVAAPGL